MLPARSVRKSSNPSGFRHGPSQTRTYIMARPELEITGRFARRPDESDKVDPLERRNNQGFDGSYGRRAGPSKEQGELAKGVSGAECPDRTTVGKGHQCSTFADHVVAVTRLPGVEDGLAGRKTKRSQPRGRPRQFLGAQALEERKPRERFAVAAGCADAGGDLESVL